MKKRIYTALCTALVIGTITCGGIFSIPETAEIKQKIYGDIAEKVTTIYYDYAYKKSAHAQKKILTDTCKHYLTIIPKTFDSQEPLSLREKNAQKLINDYINFLDDWIKINLLTDGPMETYINREIHQVIPWKIIRPNSTP